MSFSAFLLPAWHECCLCLPDTSGGWWDNVSTASPSRLSWLPRAPPQYQIRTPVM